MQNYTAEYERSMKYQHVVHTGDTGCVWSLQPEQSSKDWKMKTNQQPTGITVQNRNWNKKTGTPTIEERKKDIDQMNSRI